LTDVTLKDVAFAIPLYEIAGSMVSVDRSQMVFVYKDGSYQIHDGTAMFDLAPVWTHKGLSFADRTDDYFVGENPQDTKTVPHKKTDFQYASIALGSDQRLTIYNTGMQDKVDGRAIITDSVGHSSTKAYSTKGTLAATSLTSCGSLTLGVVGDESDFTRLHLYRFADHERIGFKKLKNLQIEAKSFSSEVLRTIDGVPTMEDLVVGSTSLPCADDTIHFIAKVSKTQTEASTEVLISGSWNIKTGKARYVPLRNSDGSLITNEYGDYGGEWSGYDYDQQSFDGSTHTFVSSETGRLMQTDVKTGVTRVLDAPKITGGAPYNGRIYLRSSKTRFYVFMLPMNDNGGIHSTVRIYDRRTTKLIKVFTIDDSFTHHLQTDSVQNGSPVINPAEPLFRE
jgi:hypothetical protein